MFSFWHILGGTVITKQESEIYECDGETANDNYAVTKNTEERILSSDHFSMDAPKQRGN